MNKERIWNLFFITGIFALDRLTKIAIINSTDLYGEKIFTITSFLNLNLIWNDGIAFGMLSFQEKNYYNFLTGIIILITASFFVEMQVQYPLLMAFLLILTCLTFSLFGFLIGIMSENFEQLQVVPLIIITTLVFLGGSLYSIEMLPEFWQKISYFNPVVYLINGMRWSFYGISDFNIWISVTSLVAFLMVCIAGVTVVIKKGYNIKN